MGVNNKKFSGELDKLKEDLNHLMNSIDDTLGGLKKNVDNYIKECTELDEEIKKREEKHELYLKEETESKIRIQELKEKQRQNLKDLEELTKDNPELQDILDKFKETMGIDGADDKHKLQ